MKNQNSIRHLMAAVTVITASAFSAPTMALEADTLVMFQDPNCPLDQSKVPGRRPEPAKVHAFFTCLNNYSAKLLADPHGAANPLVADLKLSNGSTPSLSPFSIKVPVLDTECIAYPQTPGVAKQVTDQIRSAALFLREFYKQTDGQTQGPMIVKDIEICSEKAIGRKLHINNGTLSIGLPESGFIGHRELLKLWSDGDAYHDVGFKAGIAKLMAGPIDLATAKLEWAMLNPISPLRTGIRSFLQEKGIDLAARLGNRARGNAPAAILASEIRRSSLVRHGYIDASTIETIGDSDAQLVLDTWKQNLQSPAASDALGGSMLALQSRVSRFNFKRDVWAVLHVGNWHHVGSRVTVGVTKPSVLPPEVLMKLQGQSGRTENLGVRHDYKFRGLLSFDTVDHIQSDLDIVVETAGQSSLQVLKDAMLLLALEANGVTSI